MKLKTIYAWSGVNGIDGSRSLKSEAIKREPCTSSSLMMMCGQHLTERLHPSRGGGYQTILEKDVNKNKKRAIMDDKNDKKTDIATWAGLFLAGFSLGVAVMILVFLANF